MSILGRVWSSLRYIFAPYFATRIESGTDEFPDSADVVRQYVNSIADGSYRGWADFNANESDRWVQVAHQDANTFLINFDYPFKDPIEERPRLCGIELPASWTHTFLECGTAATLAVPSREAERAIEFIDELFSKLYGCIPGYVIVGHLDG